MVTERIRLGTLLTPAARHRPWDLASRVASVDRLSDGRVTLGVGLGALHGNWLAFEPDEGRAVRARKLDEGLAIYAGLMGGQPFEYEGEHYSAKPVTELVPPPPVQRPHPPVWCVGALVPGRQRQPSRSSGPPGGRASSRRSPRVRPGTPGPVDRLRDVVDQIGTLRADAGLSMESYDVVVEGDSHGSFGEIHQPVDQWRGRRRHVAVTSWWDLPDAPEGRATMRRRLELRAAAVTDTASGGRPGGEGTSSVRATASGVVVREASAADAVALVDLRALMFEAMGTDPDRLAEPAWRHAAHGWFADHVGAAGVRVVVAEVDGEVAAGAVGEVTSSSRAPARSTARWGSSRTWRPFLSTGGSGSRARSPTTCSRGSPRAPT